MRVFEEFFRGERGTTAEHLLWIVVGAVLAAVIWKYVGPGVKAASQKMGDALKGS